MEVSSARDTGILKDMRSKYMTARAPKVVSNDFEDLYFAVRRRENRIYSDGELACLPEIDARHVHAEEWKVRRRSAIRLIDYLQKKHRSLRILEAGCGNGWLSAKLAGIPGSYVTGLDVNQIEIIQASRVFVKDNLEFVYDAFNEDTFEDEKFDVIVFAASLQYFQSAQKTPELALSLLNKGGEVHIIDTHFYKTEEMAKADERSRSYYHSLGFPQMADHYFHHSIDDLAGLKHHILLNPDSMISLLAKRGPFHWITVNP
jgi:ubiquinone/menaquinone biosynthesis C-methylase UbiE